MGCEYCDHWRRVADRLETEIEKQKKRYDELYREKDNAEARVRQLQPYEDNAKKSYDHYVTTPRDMP